MQSWAPVLNLFSRRPKTPEQEAQRKRDIGSCRTGLRNLKATCSHMIHEGRGEGGKGGKLMWHSPVYPDLAEKLGSVGNKWLTGQRTPGSWLFAPIVWLHIPCS